ncbi:MAG: Cupin 2 barrel domain-containing protein [Bacteroidetes bacterium]|nr:MAG: Cupin 2 barrel domain-containing protein [Bacteroidota bacterium]
MATNIYEPCTNPISGETFRAISFDKDAFVMQWTVQPEGYVPFEHVHLNQDEIFHVKKGEMRVVIAGKEQIAKAGESITIPKRVVHVAYNNKAEVLDCIVEYKPGLDHDVFMQCLCGLTNDGLNDKKGGISIPRMGYFLARMNAKCMARPTEIPAPLFNIALRFFYLRGVLSGWSRLFEKYTAG